MFRIPKEIGGFPLILGADAMRELSVGISFEKEKINVEVKEEKGIKIRDSELILEINENFIPVKGRMSASKEETLRVSNEIGKVKNFCAIIKVHTKLQNGTGVEIEKKNLTNELIIPSNSTQVKNTDQYAEYRKTDKKKELLANYVGITGRDYTAVHYK